MRKNSYGRILKGELKKQHISTIPKSYSTLCNTNITCDCTFFTFDDSLFFLTFDGSIVTAGSTNIIFNYTFVTFGSTLIFFPIFDNFIVTLDSTNITCDCTLKN